MANIQEKLEKWKVMSSNLARLKTQEMALRRDLCGDMLFGMPLPARKKLDIGDLTVKFEQTESITIDAQVVNSIWNKLSVEEKAAVKFKPELALKNYRKIADDSILHSAVNSKPAAPTIKIL